MTSATLLLATALLSPPTAFDLVTAAQAGDVRVAPDGKAIVFVWTRLGDADLWLASPAGGEPRVLVAEPGDESDPAFSPDGASVAFVGEGRDGQPDVFVVRLSDGALRNVSDHPARDWLPRFLADGRIAFLSDRDGEPGVYAADGAVPGAAARAWRGAFVVDHDAEASGQWLRVEKPGRRSRKVDLWWVPRRGGRGGRWARGWVTHGLPARSPDGTRLAVSAVHGARHAVALTTARGRVTGWLPAEDDADHLWPRFSPRGDSLAFVRQSAETAQLIVRMLDGTGALQVSPAEGSVTSFAWLPDGTGLVYTHGDSASPTGVYVAGLEGRPSRLLVDAAPGLERAELRPARRVRIPRPQGPALPVWVVAPRPERAGRAVIVVRDRKGRAPDEFSPAIQFLVSHRYAVVVVDLEDGGGGRPGRRRPSAAVVLDDLALAANWMVREALAAPARIGVLGEGWLAGHVALAAAAAAPDRLRAAVSIGGATELARFDDRTPADAAARVDAVLGPRRRPADLTSLVAVLWIYGTRDPWVGPAQRVRERMLERGALAPAAFYEDETAPLRGRRTRAHALEQVVDFLMKRL